MAEAERTDFDPPRTCSTGLPMGSELWVCGFNAFNQLQFDGELSPEPQDLTKFTLVLKDEHIEILRTSISATLGKLYKLLVPPASLG